MKISDITDEKKKPKVSVDKINSILFALMNETEVLAKNGFLTPADVGNFKLSILRMKDTINKKK